MSNKPKHTVLQWAYYQSISYLNEHITKAYLTSMSILPKHIVPQLAYYKSIPNFNEHITKAYRTSMSILPKHMVFQWAYYQSTPYLNEHITTAYRTSMSILPKHNERNNIFYFLDVGISCENGKFVTSVYHEHITPISIVSYRCILNLAWCLLLYTGAFSYALVILTFI